MGSTNEVQVFAPSSDLPTGGVTKAGRPFFPCWWFQGGSAELVKTILMKPLMYERGILHCLVGPTSMPVFVL